MSKVCFDLDLVSRFALKLKKLVPDVNKTSKNIMLRSFQKASKEGKTISECVKLIQEISGLATKGEIGPFSMNGAVRIASTMSTAAVNGGRVEGWQQSKVVTKKKWQSANQARTRKNHRKANNQERKLDKKFKIGKGELMYPGNPSGEAKEIVNCRCTMVAVMDG